MEVATIRAGPPAPGEVEVEVEVEVKIQSCGVCHTDLRYREGGINGESLFLLGREAVAVVGSWGRRGGGHRRGPAASSRSTGGRSAVSAAPASGESRGTAWRPPTRPRK